MKLLVSYDGSACSESALDDIVRAGLPLLGEALIISVAEVWLPPPSAESVDEQTPDFNEDIARRHREKGEKGLVQAKTLVKHAQTRLNNVLPGWKVTTRAMYGSPAKEILTTADEFDPDLIVVGSHGHSALGRLILGSVSHKLLAEADCSVRVARGRIDVDPSPARLVIGFDASAGALRAVDAVASREWPDGSEVLLTVATDSIVPTSIGRFIPPVADWAEEELRSEYEWIAHLAQKVAVTLNEAGLRVTTRIAEGNPNHILIRQAEKWNADCIFVGANSFGNRVERFLLGSTSASVAAHARCSVEVVRRKQ
ncbi:MAG: universal stress protein [Acidobacteriota bacterium]